MSGTRTFLLELHCEEIPARFLLSLANDFQDKFSEWRKAQGLTERGGIHLPLMLGYSPR